jgi:stage II sporulation protein R
MQAHKLFAIIWAGMITLLMFAAAPTHAPQPTDMLLRLHVRANSDHPADQAVKYQVRDAVLTELSGYLDAADSADAARDEVETMLPQVIAAAQSVVDEAGYDYPVSAYLGEAEFPTRLYGDTVYRAGSYQALQIYLGAGSGENWWCVLFPPLCFIEAAPNSALPVSSQIQEPPRPRSRILEWLQSIFHMDA